MQWNDTLDNDNDEDGDDKLLLIFRLSWRASSMNYMQLPREGKRLETFLAKIWDQRQGRGLVKLAERAKFV